MATLDSEINIPQGVLFRDLGDEAVILNVETGFYYGLDEVGTRMWTLLSEHGRVAPVYQDLLNEYDVTEDQLRQDLLDFIDKLASHQLLQVDDT